MNCLYQQKLCLGLFEGHEVPLGEQILMLRDAGFDGFFSGWNDNTDLLTLKKIGERAGMLYQSVHAPDHHVNELQHANAHTRQRGGGLLLGYRPRDVLHSFAG